MILVEFQSCQTLLWRGGGEASPEVPFSEVLNFKSSFDGAHVAKAVLVHFKYAFKTGFVTFEGICCRVVNKRESVGPKCCTQGVTTPTVTSKRGSVWL